MAVIFSVIFSLFLASSCQLSVKEIPDDKEFSINMTEHITVESGYCIRIPFKLTFPKDKVTVPYKKIWFKQDPQTYEATTVVNNMESESKNTFKINGLPRGEYEYGFKLEWGYNQTYIFPKRLRISVSELTRKPTVMFYPMMEGQTSTMRCFADQLCSKRVNIRWRWTKADGQSITDLGVNHFYHRYSIFNVNPTADDHNTNITCVAEYDYSIVETTVTLTVKFSPQILNGSQCMVGGKLLVCVCISRGNPLSPITWPLAPLTDYSVTSSSSIQTVNSTITMPAAYYHNSTVKCISSNELGQAEIEISLQNYTENYWVDRRQKSGANLPWITAVSFSLNLILLISLIICAFKQYKSAQKKLCKEMDTYASLNIADVAQDYSVISPQPR